MWYDEKACSLYTFEKAAATHYRGSPQPPPPADSKGTEMGGFMGIEVMMREDWENATYRG